MYSVIKQFRIFYNYICYIHMQFICGILCSVSCCELLFRHWKCKDKLYVNTMTISGFHLATQIVNESVCSQFPVYGETIANKEYHQVECHNEKQKQQASGYLINAVIYIFLHVYVLFSSIVIIMTMLVVLGAGRQCPNVYLLFVYHCIKRLLNFEPYVGKFVYMYII